ncbi:MAG: OmpL47-type beta-barrel domain-containing protein, partial [Thermoleophilia bacterium]
MKVEQTTGMRLGRSKPFRVLIITILAVLAMMVFASPGSAVDYDVNPGDSIQAAIDAASPGDTINIAAGTYDVSSTIVVNKGVTITGPAGGGAVVRGTGGLLVVFQVSSSDVVIQGLTVTVDASTPRSAQPSVNEELATSLIRIDGALGMTGIAITGNTLYVPAQPGAMSLWGHRALTAGAGAVAELNVADNTIYNTRNGVVIHYNNTATVSNNVIYDTKGGVMNYTNTQVDADNRSMSGNSWGTTHSEWDIVWNSAYYVPDFQQSVLALSGANNNGYVLDRRAADAAAAAALTGNRSHIFVDAASTYTVQHPARGSFNDPFATIALGIDAVVPGGTVYVAAGTYSEAVNVNKSVNLVGAGIGASIVQAPASLPPSSDINSAIVTVNGAGVDADITGFTIAGPGPSACGSIKAGIFVRGSANADIHGNRLVDIRDNAAPVSGCQNGLGILVGRNADATVGTANIENNELVTYQKGGIVVDGAGSDATITNNTIAGIGTTAVTAQNGIQISRGATATLTGNTVTGNSYHLDGSVWDWGATGVLLYQSGAVTLAGGNNFSGNDSALYVWDPTGPVVAGAEVFGASSAPLDWGYFVINYSSIALDLTQSTFEGVAASSASIPELLTIKGRIWDGTDESASGVATLMAGHVFVSSSGSIQNAIDKASPGDTINVAAGSYSGNLNINKSLTLSGAGAASTTIAGTGGTSVTITADNVTIDGFTVSNPSGKHGIVATDHSNLAITNNIVSDIGSSDVTTSGTNFGIGIVSSAAAVDNITITGNQVNNVVGGDHKSADAIAVGWSTGSFDVTNLLIQGNTISNITSDTSAWPAGRGAYGIIINHGTGVTGKTVAPQILDNDISDLEGLWAHGIGLEGNTPNALVQGNAIDNLVDHKSPGDPDAAAIMVEDNIAADTVTISGNSFTNTWFGVRNVTGIMVDATNNWWGDSSGPYHAVNNPSGTGVNVSDWVLFDPWMSHDAVRPTVTYQAPTGEIHVGNPVVTATVIPGTSSPLTAELGLAAQLDLAHPWDVTMWTFPCTVTGTDVSCPTDGLPEGVFTATVTVFDGNGHTGDDTGSFTIEDDAAPVTTDDADGDWHNSDVTVTLSCTDAVTGCAETTYEVDGGSTQVGNTVVLSAEGVHTITYRSVDNDDPAHVESDNTATVRIDKTAPVTTDNAPAAWQNSDVTVTLTCDDGTLSGCATTNWSTDQGESGTGDATVTVEGDNTLTYYSTDNAGNAEAAHSVHVYIDKTAP